MFHSTGRQTTTQQEIVEVKDFTVTMMLCHRLHGGDAQKLKACATQLATRFTQSFSRNLAMDAFFAESPTAVINRCIEMLNGSTARQDELKTTLRKK